MNELSIDPESFAARLQLRKGELMAMSNAAKEKRDPVELDQQSIGRLSRQDALQQQAMAKAQEERRLVELAKIEAAFTRIKENEYGWCAECGEAISPKRLEIDLTASLCAPCAGAQGL